MMTEYYEVTPPQRWPFVVAAVAGVVWLGLAILAVMPLLGNAVPPEARSAGSVAGAVVGILAPVAVLWLAAAQLRERAGSRAARTSLMEEHSRLTEQRIDHGASALILLEDRMTALVSRIEAVSAPVERQHLTLLAAVAQLEGAGVRLSEATGRTEAATVTLGVATPDATAQAERLTALLARAEDDLQRQLVQTETMLVALGERAAEAEIQARATTAETVSSLAAISDSAVRATQAVAMPLADLVAGVDNAFVRTTEAMDATRDGVDAQTSAMLASIEQARVTLDQIGGEASRQISERLEMMLETAGRVGSELDDHAMRSTALIDDVTRGFGVLDAKLDNSITVGNSAMESVTARMNEARDAIHRLGEPIGATEVALGHVEVRLAEIGTAAAETLGQLGTALPAAMPHLVDMSARLSELHDRADQLSRPLTAGGDSIAAAQTQLDRAREALDTAALKLASELVQARDALNEIETLTGSTSLAASAQLIEVFARVREIAVQTAGTMRETLSNVVAEAEAALDQAGTTRAELAFASPIRSQLAEVGALQERVAAAGQAAGERITRRLLTLAESVATVEARIDEVDTRFEVRSRSTLAKRSSKLLESMQAAAIDIAGLMSFQVEDTAWDAYLKGDKSIFARRIVEQLDGEMTRAIKRHFEHDPEFRGQATHYIEEFEALISQVLPDREGKTLAVTLLSSNIGRVYVALAQAAGRFG